MTNKRIKWKFHFEQTKNPSLTTHITILNKLKKLLIIKWKVHMKQTFL